MADRIPDLTLRTLARTFVAQGKSYGFHFEDYVHFVNAVLALALEGDLPRTEDPPDPGPLPLRGDHVSIRGLRDDDRPRMREWLTDRSGRHFLLSRSTEQQMTIDALLDDPGNVVGVIEHEGRPVGALAYLRQDRQVRKAEMRKIVGEPDLRGRGIGTEATRLWVAYGLKQLDLQKIYLYTLASNQANVSLNEQLGFRVEGVLRSEVFIDGELQDLLRMGLVAAG